MKSINRIIRLIEEEGTVDSNLILNLIHGMRTQHIQEEWMVRHMLTDIAEELEKKSEEDKISLDKALFQVSKEVKQLYGKPVEDPKVQRMVKNYLEEIFSFIDDDLMRKIAATNIEGELDIQELEDMAPSPFTEDEQKWFDQAMEYYIQQEEFE